MALGSLREPQERPQALTTSRDHERSPWAAGPRLRYMCTGGKITLARRPAGLGAGKKDGPGGVPIRRLTAHASLGRLGKNRITSEGGKCVAQAVKNSTSIVDVG